MKVNKNPYKAVVERELGRPEGVTTEEYEAVVLARKVAKDYARKEATYVNILKEKYGGWIQPLDIISLM